MQLPANMGADVIAARNAPNKHQQRREFHRKEARNARTHPSYNFVPAQKRAVTVSLPKVLQRHPRVLWMSVSRAPDGPKRWRPRTWKSAATSGVTFRAPGLVPLPSVADNNGCSPAGVGSTGSCSSGRPRPRPAVQAVTLFANSTSSSSHRWPGVVLSHRGTRTPTTSTPSAMAMG